MEAGIPIKQTTALKIRDFIVENFLFGDSSNGLQDTDSLLEKGIIDSTGVLELVSHLEETYGIKVEDEELIPENLDSIANVTDFLLRKLPQG
jgi:acyl carrier protein